MLGLVGTKYRLDLWNSVILSLSIILFISLLQIVNGSCQGQHDEVLLPHCINADCEGEWECR